MTKMFLSLMIIMFSLFMFFLNHPLSMGLMILIQTLLVSLITGMMIETYWFSYILFLTFLGGLLVLFIYVSSIASNEMFNIKMLMKMLFIMLIVVFLFISFNNYYNLKWMNFNINNYDMNNMYNIFLFFNNENKINLSKLYNSQTFMLMMMMIIFFFFHLLG